MRVLVIMVNENLVRRGLYDSVYPANAKIVIPSKSVIDGVDARIMPIPFDTNVSPTRKLKTPFKGKKMNIGDEGFNFIVRLTSDSGFANLYMLVEVGAALMFSYEIGGKVFTYPFDNYIHGVVVSDSGIQFTMFVDEASTSDGQKGLITEGYNCIVTIKNNSKDFSNGIEGKIEVESGSYFDDEDWASGPSTKGFFAPMDMKKMGDKRGLLINFTDMEGLLKAKERDFTSFKSSHLKMNAQVTYYYNENSFLNMENSDKFLREEEASWKGIDDFSDKEYVELTLAIDGATEATDTYTGVNETNNLVVKIILPDEFRNLSPMTQEADGLAFSKGKVTGKRFTEGQALFTFGSDSTECLIPNPEDKSFQAKDKNGQILKGKVIGLELKKGNSAEALRKQLATRKLNNTNKEYSFDIEGEMELDSIAWITGKKNDFIKMIVPTQDEKGKEVFKVVNINIGEL